jgi:hypothetical protein
MIDIVINYNAFFIPKILSNTIGISQYESSNQCRKKTNSNLKNIENEPNAIFYSEKFEWLQN